RAFTKLLLAAFELLLKEGKIMGVVKRVEAFPKATCPHSTRPLRPPERWARSGIMRKFAVRFNAPTCPWNIENCDNYGGSEAALAFTHVCYTTFARSPASTKMMDQLLLPYLQATDESERERHLDELLLFLAEPVIRRT